MKLEKHPAIDVHVILHSFHKQCLLFLWKDYLENIRIGSREEFLDHHLNYALAQIIIRCQEF